MYFGLMSLISQNVSIKKFWKVNSFTESSTYCLKS